MAEQRIQTIKIVWKGDEAKSKAIELSRAVSDADSTIEQLNSTMGDNVRIEASVAKSKAEINQLMRKEYSEANKLNNKYKNLTSQLQQQITATTMSIEKQERYNAMMQLGSNATLTQKKQIVGLVKQLQAQRVATGQTVGSMRNFRGVMQNAGWQVQDTIVQLQMGTSAMVVLSQQGSQFASAFGPTGAIVGAILALTGAIGGSLLPALFDLNEELDDLEKRKLDEILELPNTVANLEQEKDRITETIAEIERQKELASKPIPIGIGVGAANIRSATAKVKELGNQLRAQKASLVYLDDKIAELRYKQSDMPALLEEEVEARKKLAEQTAERVKLEKEAQDVLDAEATAREQAEARKKAAITSAFNSQALALRKQTETIEEEYERRKVPIDQYVDYMGTQDETSAQAYADLEAWKTQELKAQAEARKKISTDAQDAIDARNARLQPIEQGVQSYQTSNMGAVTAENSKYAANMRILNNELKSLKNTELADKKRINKLIEDEEDRHQDALLDAQITQAQTALSTVSGIANSMSATIDLLTTGVQDVKDQTAEMTNTQKGMFVAMQTLYAAEALMSGISMGSKLAESAALYDWTGVSSMSWIATGAAIGAAQAGAIMGTTFAGTFDKGGVIPSGQSGIVSEFGDELVGGTMVYNNSSSGLGVTGREDTASMLSNSSNSNSEIVNTTNQVVQNFTITGSGDKALQTAIEQAAKKGAYAGYNLVKSDFDNGRGIRAKLKKTTGV